MCAVIVRELVVVVGNGTSVVFNDRLASPTLAQLVAQRLPPEMGTLLVEAATQVAADTSRSTPDVDFEHLLGPLDRMATGLLPLTAIAEAVDDKTAKTLRRAQRAVRDLYLRGVGTALQVVSEESEAHHGPDLERYAEFVTWALDRVPTGSAVVRFFNLNYDPLLDSQLLEHAVDRHFEVSDQADGRTGKRLRLAPVPGRRAITALPLRDPIEPEYLPGDRSAIAYHLHGSLQWLRDPAGDAVWKAAHLEELRMIHFFDAVRERRALFEPVVVLTDRKSAAVGREPFATGYRLLEQSLAGADMLVVAGYGFRDKPLNAALSRGLASRPCKPPILVIGHGKPAVVRARALAALAPKAKAALAPYLTVRADGLPDALAHLGTWP